MAREPMDFSTAPKRGAFEAWMLDKISGLMHKQYGKPKKAAIGSMSGTVIELGPGSGANMGYFTEGTKVIGIEPNAAMHPRLKANADQYGVDYEIRSLRGEDIDVADASADGVVATLVLCGVEDQAKVISEIKRVLKPGGTYFFIEHVGAPQGTWMRKLQAVLNRPHSWLFNGCEVHRDTAIVLRDAGFEAIDMKEANGGASGLYTPDFLIGTAIR